MTEIEHTIKHTLLMHDIALQAALTHQLPF